jgi:hypothetical protein
MTRGAAPNQQRCSGCNSLLVHFGGRLICLRPGCNGHRPNIEAEPGDQLELQTLAEIAEAFDATVIPAVDALDYRGGVCSDPTCCRHRNRFPNGPWTCARCHPREPAQ